MSGVDHLDPYRRKQLSLAHRGASADSVSIHRRTRSPSGESVIEATSLTTLPSAGELQRKIREETKMSGLSISSIKTPPPFTKPSFANRTDHNSNETGLQRRSSDTTDMSRRLSLGDTVQSTPGEVRSNGGIDRSNPGYHEKTGLMRRSGRKSSVERKLEQELNTAEPEHQLEQVVEQNSYGVHEQEVFTNVQVEELPEGMTKTNFIYSQPRLQPKPGGSRVQKTTGKLLNQYEEDQRFANVSEESASATERASVNQIKENLSKAGGRKSKEKEEMERELALLRETAAERQMGPDSSDDERDKKEIQNDVMCRRPLSNIKNKYLARTQGQRFCTSSDSEDDHRKTPDKEEILGSSIGISSAKTMYSTNKVPWQHPVEKQDPRAEIANSPFSQSRQYYIENENAIPWQHPVEKHDPKQEITSPVVKSTIGYYKKIEGEVLWQHPVEKMDPLAEIERPVVKSNLDFYKSIEGQVLWQHPVSREDPKQDIDSKVFSSAKSYYNQIEGEVPWQHPVIKMNAKEEIDAAYVQTASTYFKEIEMPKQNGPYTPEQKPIVNIVQNPMAKMAERRVKVDVDLDDEDGPSDHPSRQPNKADVAFIDATQVRAHREAYKRLENNANSSLEFSVNKPKTKLIADEEAFDVMARHRKKSGEEEEEDALRLQRLRASHDMEQRMEKDVRRQIDIQQVRASRETYRTLESRTEDLTPVNRPKAKYLGFDDAQITMAEHKRKVEGEPVEEGGVQLSPFQTSLQPQSNENKISVAAPRRNTSINISSTARD